MLGVVELGRFASGGGFRPVFLLCAPRGDLGRLAALPTKDRCDAPKHLDGVLVVDVVVLLPDWLGLGQEIVLTRIFLADMQEVLGHDGLVDEFLRLQGAAELVGTATHER